MRGPAGGAGIARAAETMVIPAVVDARRGVRFFAFGSNDTLLPFGR